MSEFTILHNSRCSKSRQTLQLLEQHNIQPTVVEYLTVPPSHEQLKTIIHQLGFTSARQLLRKGEEAYKLNNLSDPDLTEDKLIDVMLANPKLIERPIVIRGNQAVLGRPPENILSLL